MIRCRNGPDVRALATLLPAVAVSSSKLLVFYSRTTVASSCLQSLSMYAYAERDSLFQNGIGKDANINFYNKTDFQVLGTLGKRTEYFYIA